MYDDLYPELASIQGSTTPYFCESVQDVLEQLGPFRYDDEQSEQMLKRSNAQPQEKPMQQLLEQQNFERYTGEWVGKQRHGRGKSVALDGSTYEGYWMNDKKNG